MRIHLTCIALALIVGVASAEARKRRHPARPDAGAPGRAGSVCHLGVERESLRHPEPPVFVDPCEPGLVCGYPCGIAGCNWVCMTPAEAQQARP